MPIPKPPSNRVEAARHVAAREQTTARAIQHWHTANDHYAKVVFTGCQPMILEEARVMAICSYEAMLDAIRTERDALSMLDAARRSPNPRKGPTPPHLRPRPKSPPENT